MIESFYFILDIGWFFLRLTLSGIAEFENHQPQFYRHV